MHAQHALGWCPGGCPPEGWACSARKVGQALAHHERWVVAWQPCLQGTYLLVGAWWSRSTRNSNNRNEFSLFRANFTRNLFNSARFTLFPLGLGGILVKCALFKVFEAFHRQLPSKLVNLRRYARNLPPISWISLQMVAIRWKYARFPLVEAQWACICMRLPAILSIRCISASI